MPTYLAEARCEYFSKAENSDELDLVLTYLDLKNSHSDEDLKELIGFTWDDFVLRDTNTICMTAVPVC